MKNMSTTKYKEHAPSPVDTHTAPELPLVALLSEALHATTTALVAAYPEVCDLERPYWLPPISKRTRQAASIIKQAHKLHRTLLAYRTSVAQNLASLSSGGDDIPF